MEKFRYQARNRVGTIVSGEQEGKTKKSVADALFAKELTPLMIESTTKGKPIAKALAILPGKRVPLTERVIFSRQFATMISAGIPIVRALNVLRNQTSNKPLKDALTHIAKDVESGITLSDALARFPHIFNQIYVSMVRAGEVGGILDDVLERLADQMEKDAEVVGKVRGAMIYPSLLFCVMIAALVFIMVVVVPQLMTVFSQIDSPLPWNTKILIWLSAFLKTYGVWVGLALVAGIFALLRLVKHNPKVRHAWHRLILKIPVLGSVTVKINLARFAQTFGALLGAGIPVLEALDVVADSLTNIIIQEEVRATGKAVRNGSSLSKSLHSSKVFPAIVPEMIAIGEETGELEKILLKLADFYSKEVSSVVANLSSVIEPLMLMIMGTAVGFVVISVIGPIYQLTSSI